VEEGTHPPRGALGDVDAMLRALPGRCCCCHADDPRALEGQLEVVEQQEHISRRDEDAGRGLFGQSAQGDEELVNKRRGAPVR